MQELTAEGRRIVEDVAQRHGVSSDAVLTLLRALVAGQGSQAQFNHPDLGGMGQWSRGGMIMIGDMFNNNLKYRVDALCTELSNLLGGTALFAPAPVSGQFQSQGPGGVSLFVPGAAPYGSRWPAELGSPASAGSQNDLHYAVFPAARRLAIERGGQVTVYDTGDHVISGFSQQQGGDQSLSFTSQYGLVRVADLGVVPPGGQAATEIPAPDLHAPPVVEPVAPVGSAPTASPSTPMATASDDDIFAKIERLADLRKKEILTAEEFEAKKTELLSRL